VAVRVVVWEQVTVAESDWLPGVPVLLLLAVDVVVSVTVTVSLRRADILPVAL